MKAAVSMMFLLDTPNVRRGCALAGTPARVLALAEYAHRAGAIVTLVLCDRGAEYGTTADWPVDVVLVHPTDFYDPRSLARLLEPTRSGLLIMCEAQALLAIGRDLADLLGARLVYDAHDDEAALAASLGEPPEIVHQCGTVQREALRAADHVIVSTRHEEHLAREAGVAVERTALLPNGADLDQRTPWGSDAAAGTLVFIGNLYYQPNARAVEIIRDLVLPPLHALLPDVHVRIVGRGPAALLSQDRDGLRFTGRVDSINEALRGVSLALAPLTAGSGAKMKVLDYLAAGLPVLGTKQAVTGLPVGHPGVLVDDDIQSWPSLIMTLLTRPALLREIGRDGRCCAERDQSWQHIGAALVRHARSWLAKLPPAPPPRWGDDVGMPRWLGEHAQGAVHAPCSTGPGRPHWLRRSIHAAVSTTP